MNYNMAEEGIYCTRCGCYGDHYHPDFGVICSACAMFASEEACARFTVTDDTGRIYETPFTYAEIQQRWDIGCVVDEREPDATLGDWLERADVGDQYRYQPGFCVFTRVS